MRITCTRHYYVYYVIEFSLPGFIGINKTKYSFRIHSINTDVPAPVFR